MRFFLFLSIVLFLACNSKSKKVTELPMSEEKIIDVLIDMHYATEASRVKRKENHDSLLNLFTKQVLEIQKIDSTQLAELMTYLESNLETYYSIEQKVHLKIKDLKNDKKS